MSGIRDCGKGCDRRKPGPDAGPRTSACDGRLADLLEFEWRSRNRDKHAYEPRRGPCLVPYNLRLRDPDGTGALISALPPNASYSGRTSPYSYSACRRINSTAPATRSQFAVSDSSCLRPDRVSE